MMIKENPQVLTAFACQIADEFLKNASPEEKHQKGVGFTPEGIATFMAHLVRLETSVIYFLDPGAGTGILTAALCDRLLTSGESMTIHADLYENNPLLIPYLKQTLQRIQETLTKSPHQFSAQLHKKDFMKANSSVISTSPLFSDVVDPSKYDVILTYPPFFKQAVLSRELKMVNQVIHGQSNTLAMFLAFCRQLLKENGQLVGLIPRTCCSGLYYKEFRKWFIDSVKIEQIHLFPPKTEAFYDRLYAENVILKLHKSSKPYSEIKISSDSQPNSLTSQEFLAPSASLIQPRDPAKVIPIPVNSRELAVVDWMRSQGQQLAQLGYRAASGSLDLNEVRSLLITEKKTEPVPTTAVLAPDHIQQFSIVYPLKNATEAQEILFNPRTKNFLVENQRYVIVRRLDRRQLPRCIEAAYYAPALVESSQIGIVKSLLCIQKERGKFSLLESLGIMAILNSDLVNRYLYIVNGIRRVSASELNKLPFPGHEQIIQIGEKINRFRQLELNTINNIVFEVLEISSELAHFLTKGEG